MRLVIQRSKDASVTVDNKVVGKIDSGLVILVGFTEGDNEGVLKIDGEADYVGSVHGDEITVDKYLYLDGIQVDIECCL